MHSSLLLQYRTQETPAISGAWNSDHFPSAQQDHCSIWFYFLVLQQESAPRQKMWLILCISFLSRITALCLSSSTWTQLPYLLVKFYRSQWEGEFDTRYSVMVKSRSKHALLKNCQSATPCWGAGDKPHPVRWQKREEKESMSLSGFTNSVSLISQFLVTWDSKCHIA